MLTSLAFVQASENKEIESFDSIIEAYRSGNMDQIAKAEAALKEMYAGSHKAVEDLINRTISEEEKLKSYESQLQRLETDVAVQKAFVEALNKRLSEISKQEPRPSEDSEG